MKNKVMEQKKVLGLVGSPNKAGRTNELVNAALDGAEMAGAAVELIQMGDHVVKACKDCLPWVCLTELKCTFKDKGFDQLSRKVLDCDALILGTPVYWGDTSGLIKYFILKMFRIYARSAPLQGLPALGISIAGGTGNGLVSGLRPVYHFFYTMQMRAIEPLPATRFNFPAALKQAVEQGKRVADSAAKRTPFQGLEERMAWYDSLPYLRMTRADERRLLAGHTTLAGPVEAAASLAGGLVRSEALEMSGRSMEAMTEVTRVYEAGVRMFDKP